MEWQFKTFISLLRFTSCTCHYWLIAIVVGKFLPYYLAQKGRIMFFKTFFPIQFQTDELNSNFERPRFKLTFNFTFEVYYMLSWLFLNKLFSIFCAKNEIFWINSEKTYFANFIFVQLHFCFRRKVLKRPLYPSKLWGALSSHNLRVLPILFPFTPARSEISVVWNKSSHKVSHRRCLRNTVLFVRTTSQKSDKFLVFQPSRIIIQKSKNFDWLQRQV